MCDFGISEGIVASIVVSLVSAAASTAMGVVSGVQQANATKAQMNYQADVNKRNAKIAQANADMKRQEGIEESRLQKIRNLQKVGAQQAAMAANGIDVSSGTALDVVEDTAAMGELDALTTRYNAETQAQAYERQANNLTNQANMDIISGQNAYKSGITGAIGSGFKGLGDTASVASRWYSPNSIGTTRNMGQVSGGVKGDNITFV